MKIAVTIFGALIFLIGSYNVINYLSDYNSLAAYGKGFVWGNGILLVFGFTMVYFFSLKKSNNP